MTLWHILRIEIMFKLKNEFLTCVLFSGEHVELVKDFLTCPWIRLCHYTYNDVSY